MAATAPAAASVADDRIRKERRLTSVMWPPFFEQQALLIKNLRTIKEAWMCP